MLKPAETTPLTALLFCDVLRQAELPPGVVNIVTGDGRAGAALVDADVDKIAFTGSTEVGKAIQRRLAGTGKKLTLELGGKAANIVFDDAALDQAVEGIVNGIYFNQGHVCCAGSRLFVQESIAEPLIDKLKQRMATLRVGDPLDKNTDLGAINSKAQLEKIEELVAAGEAEGAEIYQPPCRLPERGYWFAPTVFTNVAQSYRIAQEEIFGPVLSVLTFRTPDEAIEKANNTPYGLSAGVWTEKGSRILWMAERLRAGVVWANTFNRFDPASPFGGYTRVGLRPRGRPARARAVPRVRLERRVIETRPAPAGRRGRARRRSTSRRGRWLSSPAPRPEADSGWTFFGERTKPEDVLVAIAGRRGRRLREARPLDAARRERPRRDDQRPRGRRPRSAAAASGRALIDAAAAEARRRGARRLTLRVLAPERGSAAPLRVGRLRRRGRPARRVLARGRVRRRRADGARPAGLSRARRPALPSPGFGAHAARRRAPSRMRRCGCGPIFGIAAKRSSRQPLVFRANSASPSGSRPATLARRRRRGR